ncbi:major facilitator superfamily domain-containing protein [Aspergillus navahoensis]
MPTEITHLAIEPKGVDGVAVHASGDTSRAPDSNTNDVAFSVYIHANDRLVTEEEKLRVRRKVDLYLMPWVVLGFLQYLDKSAISYAALYNLQEDLGMTSSQFSWTSSAFYFGTLIWQYPSLMLLQRFHVGRYFASQVLGWGAISFLMAASSNFGGFFALRFLLGAFECVQMPAFVLITSMYYTREEQPLRMLFWYGTNGIAIIAGGLFAYGVGHINSSIPLWKYPFLICGALSVAWSAVLFLALPANPSTAWFLTPAEREIAIKHVENNQTGIESKVFKKEQAIEALTDPKVILAAFGAGVGNILSGLNVFGTLVIRGFGFTVLQTTLLQCPTGLVEIIAMIAFTLGATYIPNSRVILSSIATAVALVGTIILYAFSLDHRWVLIVGLLICTRIWLAGGFIPSSFILGQGLNASNIAGHTKKVTAQGFIFVIYAAGSIVGPQLYNSPPYRQGLRANFVALSILLLLNMASFFYLCFENRRRQQYREAHPELQMSEYLFRDLTDKQNPFCVNKI